MQDILDGYAAAATPAFVAAYDSLSPEAIYEQVIDLFPGRGARMVDIGAGTGRDAAWFAERMNSVLAVEPGRELREGGRERHRSARIAWLDDRLPELTKTRCRGPFDLITLCAVWQHLTDAQRVRATLNLAAMTAPRGLIVMSLRHGPGAAARRVFSVSPDATIEDACRCRLRLIRRREAESVQSGNRAIGVRWTWLAFEKLG